MLIEVPRKAGRSPAEGITLSGVPQRDKDWGWIALWRIPLRAGAEGAKQIESAYSSGEKALDTANLSGKKTELETAPFSGSLPCVFV